MHIMDVCKCKHLIGNQNEIAKKKKKWNFRSRLNEDDNNNEVTKNVLIESETGRIYISDTSDFHCLKCISLFLKKWEKRTPFNAPFLVVGCVRLYIWNATRVNPLLLSSICVGTVFFFCVCGHISCISFGNIIISAAKKRILGLFRFSLEKQKNTCTLCVIIAFP